MSYLKKQNSDLCEECEAKCCRYLVCSTNKDDNHKLDFWDTVGAVRYLETEDEYIYLHANPCQHVGTKEQKYKCQIYEDRPQLCKDFPKEDLPRLWRSICPLYHERIEEKDKIFRVFKPTQ